MYTEKNILVKIATISSSYFKWTLCLMNDNHYVTMEESTDNTLFLAPVDFFAYRTTAIWQKWEVTTLDKDLFADYYIHFRSYLPQKSYID